MLQIDSVSLQFGDRPVLSGCYLSCSRHEVVGLLGRNGSGKSSLLKIIFGTLKADFSYLEIDGKLQKRAFKSRLVAYLPQDPFLPPFLYCNELTNKVEQSLLEIVPGSILKQLEDKQVRHLSGGELRLLELLFILNLPAPYLLLNEPFTRLSPLLIETMQKLIKQASQTKGIILTDHLYNSLIAISDRLVLMHNNSVYPIKDETDLKRYGYLSY